jgi:protein phosphatase
MSTPLRETPDSPQSVQGPLGGHGLFTAHSCKGHRHDVNQDCLGWAPGFLAVADGVGSGAQPELASQLLFQALRTLKDPQDTDLRDCLSRVDQDIAGAMQQRGLGPGASVFSAVWLKGGADGEQPLEVLAAHVGDCKVLHLRAHPRQGWQVMWQTLDQSYVNMGRPAPLGVLPTSPANMVGCGMSAEPGIHRFGLKPGDRLLVCSDGAQQLLDTHWLLDWMNQGHPSITSSVAQSWCEQAFAMGNHDDISVAALEYRAASQSIRRWSFRRFWRV